MNTTRTEKKNMGGAYAKTAPHLGKKQAWRQIVDK